MTRTVSTRCAKIQRPGITHLPPISAGFRLAPVRTALLEYREHWSVTLLRSATIIAMRRYLSGKAGVGASSVRLPRDRLHMRTETQAQPAGARPRMVKGEG